DWGVEWGLMVGEGREGVKVVAGPRRDDACSRGVPLGALAPPPPRLRLGVPRDNDKIFFDDPRACSAFAAAEAMAQGLGADLIAVDLTVFFETARLLYEGACLAERTAAVGDFIARNR